MNHYEIETCVIGAKNGNKDDLLKVLEQYKPFIFKTARTFKIKIILSSVYILIRLTSNFLDI